MESGTVMSTSTLEQRIAAALSDKAITSAKLADLVRETETAIKSAEQGAAEAKRRALDPITSPDAVKARAMSEAAEFARDRLKTVLPRIKERFDDLRFEEAKAAWVVQQDELKAEHAALYAELLGVYPRFVAHMVALLTRFRRHCDRAHAAPAYPELPASRRGEISLGNHFSVRDPLPTLVLPRPDNPHDAGAHFWL
jgi:hypothetical protein